MNPNLSSSIYIIGVPAAGKTTLVNALIDRLKTIKPQLRLLPIHEVAREVVIQEGVIPKDIQDGKTHAMNLQRMILETQAIREQQATENADLVVSDRSGIDPIVFAVHYGKSAFGEALLDCEAWKYLRMRMQSGLVILCEPQPQWFIEDGVRFLPASFNETLDLHMTFLTALRAQAIPFKTIPSSQTAIEDRVQVVVELWTRKTSSTLDTCFRSCEAEAN